MLSWSSHETGEEIDLTEVAAAGDDIGLDHGGALMRYASACGGTDDGELLAARRALVDETDEALMVDAGAVAANFEMMTRLADATGARLRPERIEQSAMAIGVMGIADLTSRR